MRSEIKNSVSELNEIKLKRDSMNWKTGQKKIFRMKYKEKKEQSIAKV